MRLVPFKNNELSNFDSFFDSFTKPFFKDFTPNEMKIDITENEKDYKLKAEVPGVDQKDIEILVKDNILTITAKREELKTEEKENYIRRERYSGTTSRSFNLDGINDNDIEASFDNGVLTLALPKLEESKPKHRKIELK